MALSRVVRLWRADGRRRSRWHTQKAQLCLRPDDMARAFATTAWRHLSGRLSVLPWLTYPAIRFLGPRLSGRRLFEFGAGLSTPWYAARCREVTAVEHDPAWARSVAARTGERATILLESRPEAYVAAIERVAWPLDAVVVDGIERLACAQRAAAALHTGGLLVLDNTDAWAELDDWVVRTFPSRAVRRFPGWVPGIGHPNETTAVVLP